MNSPSDQDDQNDEDRSYLEIQSVLKHRASRDKARVLVALWQNKKVVAKVFDSPNAAWIFDSQNDSGDGSCLHEANAYRLIQQGDAHVAGRIKTSKYDDSIHRDASPGLPFVHCYGIFEATIISETEKVFYSVILIDYFEGVSLDELGSVTFLAHDVRRCILQQIANAFCMAYDRGVLHRSVYPRNVVICKDEPRIKLVDLGRWEPSPNQGFSTDLVDLTPVRYQLAKIYDSFDADDDLDWFFDIDDRMELFWLTQKEEIPIESCKAAFISWMQN